MSYELLFDAILSEMDEKRDDEFSRALASFHEKLRDKLLPPDADRSCHETAGAQSKEFMRHIADDIQAFFRRFPYGSRFSILDVGPGTAAGSEWLASIYRRKTLGYTATVETIDIDDTFLRYQKVMLPYIKPMLGRMEDLTKTYDVVIASHVIEHVDDPVQFCSDLQRMSRGVVIVCAPFEERKDQMTSGHLHSLDDEFLKKLEPVSLRKIESAGWGQFMDPPYKMFVATLNGKAESV